MHLSFKRRSCKAVFPISPYLAHHRFLDPSLHPPTDCYLHSISSITSLIFCWILQNTLSCFTVFPFPSFPSHPRSYIFLDLLSRLFWWTCKDNLRTSTIIQIHAKRKSCSLMKFGTRCIPLNRNYFVLSFVWAQVNLLSCSHLQIHQHATG